MLHTILYYAQYVKRVLQPFVFRGDPAAAVDGDGPFPVVATIHGGEGNRDVACSRTRAVPGGVFSTVTRLNEQARAVLLAETTAAHDEIRRFFTRCFGEAEASPQRRNTRMCWLSGPLVAREAIESLLGVEAPRQLAALVAIGMPATVPAAGHDRKPLDETLRFID